MLESAREAHREGRYAEAESFCRDLLERTPADGEVPYLLGLVLHQTGRESEAEKWLLHSAALAPQSPNAYYALGCVYAAAGDAASAAEVFAAALRRQTRPRSAGGAGSRLANETCAPAGQAGRGSEDPEVSNGVDRVNYAGNLRE